MVELSVDDRAAIHAALSDPYRLHIVDELALSERSPSELASLLDIGSNLLAHHVDVLADAGLVERLASAGDGRRRYVRLIPDALAALASPIATLVARSVLFVCTENSARSQLAALLWNARHEVPASSAGTRPAPRVRAEAIRAAERARLDLRGARTRSIDDVAESPDLIITVCDVAREDLRWLADDGRLLHWSIPDPVPVGTPKAFDDALHRIGTRVETLAPHVRSSGARGAERP